MRRSLEGENLMSLLVHLHICENLADHMEYRAITAECDVMNVVCMLCGMCGFSFTMDLQY